MPSYREKATVKMINDNPDTGEIGIVIEFKDGGDCRLLVYDRDKMPPVFVGQEVDIIITPSA